jgi:hypothetical protein
VRHLQVERLLLNRILTISEFIVWNWRVNGFERACPYRLKETNFCEEKVTSAAESALID